MRTSPEDYPKIFGRNFATRNNGTVLAIGHRQYTKYQLGAIGCPHTAAARELHRVIQQLGITSLENLARYKTPEDFVGIKGFGETAFYALTCVLRDAKLSMNSFYKSKVTVSTLTKHARQQQRKRRRAS